MFRMASLDAAVVQFVEGGNKSEKGDRNLSVHVFVGYGIRRGPGAV